MYIRNIMRGGIAVMLLLLLIMPALTFGPWKATPEGQESFPMIADSVFHRYAFPFEVLSVLLLAALIGAVFLAKRERER